jgi:glyoxylase-like metal-dependent hydrolase (beta-lactamase superfamily II)
MMVITAESDARTFCFLTDLVPTAAHLTPTWITAFDLDPLQSVESKLRWLTDAARGEWVCAFGHDTGMPFARIMESEGRFEADGI